jgi:DNA-binding IclR family transcriptional regulator
LVIGAAAQEQVSFSRVAKPLLEELGPQCNESLLVRIRDGLETVCVAWWDAPHAVRVQSQLGNRRPLYVGASGKLLLAYAPANVQEEVLSGKREQFTPNTLMKRTQLEAELKKICKDGYSMSIAERSADTIAIAVPVRETKGEVVVSLSMTAPLSRVSKDDARKYIELLKTAAQKFSKELGYMEK